MEEKGYDSKWGRREFAKMVGGSSLSLGFLPLTIRKNKISQKGNNLAQDFTIAVKAPGNNHHEGYIYFNGFVKISDGIFIVLAVIDQPNKAIETGVKGHQGRVILSRSEDGGKSWKELDTNLNFGQRVMGGALFYYKNNLYMFTSPFGDDGIIFVSQSKDEGASWGSWVEVIRIPKLNKDKLESDGIRLTLDDDPNWAKGQRWIAYVQQSMIIKNGTLFFAVSERTQDMAIVSCDLDSGLLNPYSWKISDIAPVSIPKELKSGFSTGPSMSTLEGNVIEINGHLRLLARQVVDGYGTSNIAAIFDVKDNSEKPELSFSQFFPIPGAQGLFTIVYDDVSSLFWMSSNLETNSQNLIDNTSVSNEGRDRRFLMLWYSLDALNWFPAGCIAAAEKMEQTFNYPSMIIDENDLAVVSRTTLDADNYTSHDADTVTFHRIHNFRSLALNLHPVP